MTGFANTTHNIACNTLPCSFTRMGLPALLPNGPCSYARVAAMAKVVLINVLVSGPASCVTGTPIPADGDALHYAF